MSKKNVNQGHYTEAMHTAHILCCMIEDHMLYHPAIKSHKKIIKKLEDAQSLVAEAYQMLGEKSYNQEQKEKG